MDIPLRLPPGEHNLSAAYHAAEPEIRSGAQYKPAPAAAGMALFHFQNVTYPNFHRPSRHFFMASQYAFVVGLIVGKPFSIISKKISGIDG